MEAKHSWDEVRQEQSAEVRQEHLFSGWLRTEAGLGERVPERLLPGIRMTHETGLPSASVGLFLHPSVAAWDAGNSLLLQNFLLRDGCPLPH